MRRWTLGLLMLVSCGDPVGPDVPKVHVKLVEQTTGGPARSVITVKNEGVMPIYIGGCGVWIQGLRGGEWHIAYSPSCVGGYTTVEPGASHVREYAFLPSEAYPQDDNYRPAAAYKLLLTGEELHVFGASLHP